MCQLVQIFGNLKVCPQIAFMCFVRIIFFRILSPSLFLVLALFLFLLRSFLSLLHVKRFIQFSVPFAHFSCTTFLFVFLSSISCFLTSFFLHFFLVSIYSSFEHMLIAIRFCKRIKILTHSQVVCDSGRPPALPQHQVELSLCLVSPW